MAMVRAASPDLLYRRQFLLAPREMAQLGGWQCVRLADNLVAHAHPDLPITLAEHDDVKLLLLGFMIDPYCIDASDVEILNGLATNLSGVRELIRRTASKGGRWVLLYHSHDATALLTDPCGLRPVFFVTDSTQPYCASQPTLLAEVLGLSPDRHLVDTFVTRCTLKTSSGFLPGDLSGYANIRSLLPNHYYDLRRGTVHRFWPEAPLGAISLAEGAQRTADLLRRQMRAIAQRYKLCLGLTAGFDTRANLAACREFVGDIDFHTHLSRHQPGQHVDVAIASRLAARLGLKHRVVRCPKAMNDGLAAIYRRNVAFAHDVMLGPIVEGLLEVVRPGAILVKGSATEIVKSFYKAKPHGTATELLALECLPPTPEALAATEQWLAEASPLEDSYGVNVLDLYCWELKMGKWQAMHQCEYDLVTDCFAPFNCRELLAVMLAVDQGHRSEPSYELFAETIRRLWPEALDEPVNPRSRWQVAWQRIMPLAHRIPGYWTLRRWRRWITRAY
jgi:hypothetical protein